MKTASVIAWAIVDVAAIAAVVVLVLANKLHIEAAPGFLLAIVVARRAANTSSSDAGSGGGSPTSSSKPPSGVVSTFSALFDLVRPLIKRPALATLAFVLVIASGSLGCAALRPATAPPDVLCERYSDRYIVGGTVAAFSGAGAGVGGLSSGLLHDDKARLAVGLTSLGVGMIAAGATYYSNAYAARYTERCK